MTCVLVTGATGFVGHRLVPALVEAGHDVRAMTRNPDTYDGEGEPVGGDVGDPDSIAEALAGVDVAIYMVHSLDDADFERKDAQAAQDFGLAAAACGVRQIVYLGGLGADDEDLSPHLRSRREVEGKLAEGGVPVTVLRAAIVVGAGGISWEITRQLVKNLPAMVVPRWVGHPHPADRPRGRRPLPRRRGGRGAGARQGLRDRRPRGAHLPRHDEAGRRGDGPARAADRDRAGADAVAVVALDLVRHRRRHHHRQEPHRLDVDRGRRHRRLDPRRSCRATRSATARRCGRRSPRAEPR